MAHLWLADGPQWSATPLEGDAFLLGTRGPEPLAAGSGSPALLRSGAVGDDSWLVLTADIDLRVNGTPALLGISALSDRDEIRVPGRAPVFFSTERLACVVPYPGGDGLARCPRCKQPMEVGTPAVRCPAAACRIYHHEDPAKGRPCWTYAPECALCPQPTALDAGYRWMPGDWA